MEHYLLIKWLHILSATLMFGTGLGTAFYMFVTNRSGNVQAIAVITRWVARADWWFTTPSVIFQPISGLLMVYWLAYPLNSPWLLWSMLLYALAGACWLPVVWLQLQMRDMAQIAARDHTALPARYWRFERMWTVLGFPAFISLIVVYWLMVNKPI
ncbi:MULTISPECIES: DUF2269 family protein [Deefgea]|uniref:DUF2269 family protein n=1 Tax=Deefgea chitinilytica TaxID=570276 RepID=A0ABS2C7Z8_9NEIS|nr:MULTISPECIES: DUF2269 domain-containing protein [Deefgea]MBM5570177.1 DUF2269 family protein [Deefgea chitinilytica]MBM9887406.1 DUF2269 domain-containing protein [Deefgea sp. CFH1-16]